MKQTVTLAIRNLLRNQRRSFTTLLSMIVGVSAILLFGGYSKDITYGLQTDFVQRSGHLQIQRQGYYLYGSGNPSAYGIDEYERLIEVLRNDPVLKPMLAVVTPTLQLGGIAGNFPAAVSRTVLVQGLIPSEQSRMRTWNDYGFPITPRPNALEGSADDRLVIGEGVARILRLCAALGVGNCTEPSPLPSAARLDAPGDVMALSALEATAENPDATHRIEILAASTQGAPNVGSFVVQEAEQQGVKELDDVHVSMHLLRAQRLVYGNSPPQVSAVLVQLNKTAQLAEARKRIDALLHDLFAESRLEVLDFAELNPFYDQTNRMFSAIFGFVFTLISAIVLFVVGNTMSMAILERTAEIGTLRAIGLRRGGVQKLFIAEGLVLGVTGAGLGVAVAVVIAAVINASGLTWTPPARIDAVALTVRVWGEWRLIAFAFFGLALVAVLSAWWPAKRASQISIVNALRHT
jgi:putative ABC transport system permease protein